jgi:hypothetical protein
MKGTKKAALGALPLMVVANLALAGEPVQLSDQQMDGVTAAGSALALAGAAAIGGGLAFTATSALAVVQVVSSASGQVTTINLVRSDSQAQSLSIAN